MNWNVLLVLAIVLANAGWLSVLYAGGEAASGRPNRSFALMILGAVLVFGALALAAEAGRAFEREQVQGRSGDQPGIERR